MVEGPMNVGREPLSAPVLTQWILDLVVEEDSGSRGRQGSEKTGRRERRKGVQGEI